MKQIKSKEERKEELCRKFVDDLKHTYYNEDCLILTNKFNTEYEEIDDEEIDEGK